VTTLFRTAFAALVISATVFSPSAYAQFGSASLIHTVAVTVAPRVKVEAQAFSTTQRPSMSFSKTTVSEGGVRLSINATQRWVLTVGTSASAQDKSQVRWSSTADGAFATVTSKVSTVATGTLSSQPAQTDLFLRTDGTAGDAAPILLTIVTP
jgi:hypothetical protein